MNNDDLEKLLQYKNIYEVLMQRFDSSIEEYKQGKVDLPPDVYLLNLSNKILIFYRRVGDKKILELSKEVRRAAHKTHWKMLRLKYTKKNNKFINMV